MGRSHEVHPIKTISHALLAGLTTLATIGYAQETYADSVPVGIESSVGDPLQAGSTIDMQFAPHQVVFGNLTSIGTTNSGSFSSVFGKDGGNQGSSTTNPKGKNEISANGFIASTGTSGILDIYAGVAAQHEVGDVSLVVPEDQSGLELLSSPKRLYDNRPSPSNPNGKPYVAGSEVVIDLGPDYANEVAVINLTIDRPDGQAFFAAYPCGEYNGTSTVNPSGEGATPALDMVAVNSEGKVCVKGNRGAQGVIIDLLGKGYKKIWKIFAPKRIMDTRETHDSLQPGVERYIETGVPNAVFIGRLTVDNAKQPGWTDVHTTSIGYQGGSLVNPDGKGPTSGLIRAITDENGRLSILSNIPEDVIVDMSGLMPVEALGIKLPIPKSYRIVDTREIQFLPSATSCEKVAWLEQYFDFTSGHMMNVFYVYDDKSKTATAYNAPDLGQAVNISHLEYDPAACDNPRIVYDVMNDDGTKYIEKRDLITGAVTRVDTSMIAGASKDEPDPQSYPATNPRTYFRVHDNNGNNVRSTEWNDIGDTAVNEFALPDDGRALVRVLEFTELNYATGRFEQNNKIVVTRYSNLTRDNYMEYSTDTMLATNTDKIASIEISPDGARTFVSKMTNGRVDQLFEVVQSRTNQLKADLVPFRFLGQESEVIKGFRLASKDTIVATVQKVGQNFEREVAIDIATGKVTELSAPSHKSNIIN